MLIVPQAHQQAIYAKEQQLDEARKLAEQQSGMRDEAMAAHAAELEEMHAKLAAVQAQEVHCCHVVGGPKVDTCIFDQCSYQ